MALPKDAMLAEYWVAIMAASKVDSWAEHLAEDSAATTVDSMAYSLTDL